MIELRINLDSETISESSAIEMIINLEGETIRADLAKRNEIKVMMTEKGADGKTPIKGVDYLTAEDIQQITNQVYIEVATIEDIRRLF